MIRHYLLLFILILAACGGDQLEGRPDEPASPSDGFRSDDPDTVGKTGRPQLVELWADW